MRRVHQVSGGAGSWLATKVDMRAHPEAEHVFMFADTLYEDADCYRFLIEGLLHLLGRRVNWLPRASDFPDYRVSESIPIEEYEGNPDWRAYLAGLRDQAAIAIPELTWLVEGRDPWEVFRDERFLGNSRVDPCSRIIKRQHLDKWRDAHFDSDTDVLCIGIGPHEAHRYHGLKARMDKAGWRYEAPLLGTFEGEVYRGGDPLRYLDDAGIDRPRLYRLGYTHNNCGGFCIKAGIGHYQNRLREQPERFAYDAMMEGKLAAFLGREVSMLTDRSGDGAKKPMTLTRFEEAYGRQTDFEFTPGDSGCGCMIDEEEAA